jgi:glycosyltransferase involved in cell wall biosynthesis
MKAVVHVVVAGEIGGAERMLVDLANPRGEERSTVHSVALMTPNPALRKLFLDEGLDVDDAGPVGEGPLPYLATSLGSARTRWLSGVLARRNACIAHLHTFASQVVGTRAARIAGACIVRTEHSTRVYDDPTCWPFSRWSLGRTDAVVFISEHVRARAMHHASRLLSTRTTRVVHNGIRTTHFSPRNRGDKEKGSGPCVFGAIGRLDHRKGLDLAIEAITRVPEAELSIVGDGAERAALERLAKRLGVSHRVRFHGHVTDVRDAVAQCDVALSSSREEGLGIALLEAMALELPVVARPVGGIPEIVVDGQTGWLAQGLSIDALTQAMRAATSSRTERDRRGRAAREHVVSNFSVEAMRARYEDVYTSLATGVRDGREQRNLHNHTHNDTPSQKPR